jgi:hypothetical protein
LRRTLGDRIHTRQVALFQGVEFPMQFIAHTLFPDVRYTSCLRTSPQL